MTREIIGFTLVLLVLAIALLVARSVKGVRAKQESVLPLIQDPVAAGDWDSFYVATVFADKPLERIWAYGLGIRGRSTLAISNEGVSIHRVGERGFLIPTSGLESIGSAQATIDKGVERDGLTTVVWLHGDVRLQSVFRFTNPEVREGFTKALDKLIGAKLG